MRPMNPTTQIIDGIEYELTPIGEVESNGHIPARRTGWTAAELSVRTSRIRASL
jgi:hypothetical protein